MSDSRNNKSAEPSKLRKIIYNILLLIFIPGIIFFISELLLRAVNYGDKYDLFIDFPSEDYQEYRFINPEVGRKYFQRLDLDIQEVYLQN